MNNYKPVVGDHIEFNHHKYGWIGGKVVGFDNTVILIKHNNSYDGYHPHEVRPIRTQEEMEREEAIDLIMQYAKVKHPLSEDYYGITFAQAESLVKAGYHNGPKVGERVSKEGLFVTIYSPAVSSVAMHKIVDVLLNNYDIYKKVVK